MICSLLSRIGILSFEPRIRARAEVVEPLRTSIDGGAGWGDTATMIAFSTAKIGVICAVEPFPGNHRFFEGLDPRVKLVKNAISDTSGPARFVVPQIVPPSVEAASPAAS